MKKRITLSTTQLSNKQRTILYDGIIDVDIQDDFISFAYLENDSKTKVWIKASNNCFKIERKGEMSSLIPLELNKKTKGSIVCEYGVIDLSFYMSKYFFFHHQIALEYDVYIDGQRNDSMRIVCKVKEVEA